MARETKVGLLIGLGMVLLIGIIISDHLAVMDQNGSRGELTRFAEKAQQSVDGTAEGAGGGSPHATDRRRQARRPSGSQRPSPRVIQTPAELQREQARSQPRADRQAAAASADQPRSTAAPPNTTRRRGLSLAPAYRLDPLGPAETSNGGEARPDRAQSGRSAGGNSAGPLGRSDRAAIGGGDRHSTGATATAARPSERSGDRSTASAPPRATDAHAPTAGSPGQNETDQTEQPAETNGATSDLIHPVEPGESLFEIAQKYYGNGRYWRSIAQANPEKVSDEGQVRKGVTLTIPDRAGRANRTGASSRDTPAPAAASEAEVSPMEQVVRAADSGTVTVRRGDTLVQLAEQYLGDRGRWRAFVEHNPDQLESAADLQAGMTLDLPPPGADRGPNARPRSSREPRNHRNAQANEDAGDPPATYTVQPEDTLYRIAQQKLGDGDAWRTLYKANQDTLDSPDDLTVGQTLRIPRP